MHDPEGPRDARFAEGVRALRVGAASIRVDERTLLVLGGVLVPLGIIVVLLGWRGAAHQPYVFDQLPYVISGGLLGLAFVFLGGFLYFAYWLTQLVKEQRRQSASVLAALERLSDRLDSTARTASVDARPRGDVGASEVRLVATSRGTMAHRPDCAVVAGKHGLRSVTPAEGLAACKLCGSG
jgi:hypothetical protein